jgi:RNA polymerase sigma-70 factor (ECF subfamily)
MSLGARTPSDLPDEEVVRLFQSSGDPHWFGELYGRYRRRVYCSCRGFFRDGAAAEDATQDTFIRAFQNIRSFEGGNFGGWLMRIAKNVCIDHWRKRRPEADADDPEVANISKGEEIERTLDLATALEKLYGEIAVLPAEQQACIRLKIEGYSYEETAAHTGLPVEAVKSHLQNGRRMLWSKMEATLSHLR